ncbi:hypothetical protein BaRGS_00033881 [Batillaria attramentaria]|uniref:Uncharacterized protein n=1 Tax=Batillaria attramentaria TaxID=370345 RepID=A0ABD0JIT7_9CAEN
MPKLRVVSTQTERDWRHEGEIIWEPEQIPACMICQRTLGDFRKLRELGREHVRGSRGVKAVWSANRNQLSRVFCSTLQLLTVGMVYRAA